MSEKFQDNKFSVMAGGKEIVCDILFKFQSQQTGKHYMAFPAPSKDRDGNPSVFYATYDPDAEDISLAPIQSEQEWMMVRDMMQELSEKTVNTLREKMMQAQQDAEAQAKEEE